MNGEIKVLQIDDDEIDVRLVKRALAKHTKSPKFVVESASCLADGLNLLKTKQYDVLLLDLGLPDSNGIETVQSVSKVNSNIPIVVLTGLENEETGLEAIKNGASDYLVKGPAMETSLVRTALYAIERKKVAEKLHESQQMLAACDEQHSSRQFSGKTAILFIWDVTQYSQGMPDCLRPKK